MLKRVLMFDVNRILYADIATIGRDPLHPIVEVVLKAILGWFIATMLTFLVIVFLVDDVTPAIERLQRLACLVLVALFVAPDVRRLFRRSSPS